MDITREVLNIVVVGHVDHGKSTVIGRLLYDTKSLPEGAIERVKKIAKEKGKPFEYAYLLDAFEEEQKHKREESSKPTPKDERYCSRGIENDLFYKYGFDSR